MRPVSRRQFIQQTAVAGAVGLIGSTRNLGAASVSPLAQGGLVGSQLYGWGQYYDRDGRRLDEHLGEALKALKDIGYDYAEGSLDTAHPENNARFADQLRANGLRPVSLYTGGALHLQNSEQEVVPKILKAAEVCKTAGFQLLVCNPDPIGREKTDEELLRQAAALSRLGTGLKKLGMGLGLHHHTPEMVHEAREFHSNFRRSDAGVVDFCFDVHWVYRGGLAPMKALELYHNRVISWHLRQSRDQIWWEDLDSGDIDYAAIATYANLHKIPKRYTVELALEAKTKITRNAVENHRRSREFVKKVLGV